MIAVCLPASDRIGPGDRFLVTEAAKVAKTPKVALATKTDLVAPDRMVEHLAEIAALGEAAGIEWATIVPVSATSGYQVDLRRRRAGEAAAGGLRRSTRTATSPTSRRRPWSPS